MSLHTPVSNAVRWALLGAVAATVAAPQAFAADEPKGEVERIEVTGSRIKRTDIEGSAPVLTISRAEIESTGSTNIGELLQRVPAAGSALNRTFNNGGDGTVRMDMRNLGANRTLVLVNGRRWVNGGTGADSSVDMNTIPMSIVERLEVLKDGASAVYGSDAIAGVINIITRKDFEGVQISAQTGQYEHGDGDSQQIELVMGSTSEKGNVTAGMSWNKDKPVWAGDRVFARSSANINQHSGTTPQGHFYGVFDTNGADGVPGADGIIDENDDSMAIAPCGTACTIADYREFRYPGDRYNFNPDNYIMTPAERRSAFANASYQLTDSVSAYGEFSYVNRISDQSLASIPVPFGAALGDDTVIAANNPFNPTGNAIGDDEFEGVARRFVEAGRRSYLQDIDTYRLATGFTGEFSDGWSWDVNYIYGKNDSSVTQGGQLNVTKLRRSLGDAQVCTDFGDGCTPLNVFGGVGSITPAMLDYIGFIGHDAGGNEMEELSANISGDLFDLPAGALGFAGGIAKREENGFDSPDALVASGETTGNARKPTEGNYSVKEAYVEFNIPLISDIAIADSIELSLASRYSDYNTFGETTNSKLGLSWRVNPDIMLRSTWSQGFRAPSIYELFGGRSDDYPQVEDPCDVRYGGATNASCIADGVPPTFRQPNTQIRITGGSNDELDAETSETTTAGVVFSPSWYEGSSITLDWYNIQIEQAVSTLGAQTILDDCYPVSGVGRSNCDLITRLPNGFVDDLLDINQNAAELEVMGADLNFSTATHETGFGSLRGTIDASYVAKYEDSASPHLTAGILAATSRAGNYPRWKSNGTLSWEHGDWSASWSYRYIHHVKLSSKETPAADRGNILGSAFFNDIQASYNFSAINTRLTLGVDNVLDNDPPFTRAAFANSFDPSYSMPGPYGYLRATTKF